MPAENLPLDQLWAQTVDLVKDRVNSRSLWETMEKAVAITVEDDTLIIGLNSRIFNMAGHLNIAENRNAIEAALAQLAGRPLRMRVIEGEDLADWHYTQKREERVAAMRQATYDRRDKQAAEAQSWESLYEYVARAYSAAPIHNLPQGKARYLADMLYVLADAMDSLYTDNADESVERLVARVIDRVAHYAEVPSALVALELTRLRTWRQQQSEPA